MGIIIKHEIRIPSLNNHYVMESKAGLFSWHKGHPEFNRIQVGDDSFSPWKTKKYRISILLVMSFAHRIGAVVFFPNQKALFKLFFSCLKSWNILVTWGQYLKKLSE